MNRTLNGILLLAFFFTFMPLRAQEPERKMSIHLHAVPFDVFRDQVFRETGIMIFYQEGWVRKLSVSLDADSITVEAALRQVLRGSNLEVSGWHGQLVLLPNDRLLSDLPPFEAAGARKDSISAKAKQITEAEAAYLTGRKTVSLQVIRIGKNGGQKNASRARILGRIVQQETGEPVIGATMYVEEVRTGAASDQNGFLSMVLKPGKYNARFEYLGLEKKNVILDVVSDGDFTLEMKKTVITVKEVVITDFRDRQASIKSKDAGLERVSVKAIREIPTMMGERDILKVSGMLPGIVSVGEGSAGLNVRGGSSDQNAFYINKIPVYATSHLFGFFTAFNSDIIKDFSIYKGQIPAKYGGRLSSVFNIITGQGNRKQYNVHGGVSPVAANLVIEGPLKKDACSFLLSARSSYSDWILQRIKDPTIRNSSANFSDFSASVSYDLKKTQLMAFVYHSEDRFRLSDINRYEYSNNGASLNYSHNFGPSLRGELALIASEYAFSTVDEQEQANAYQHKYKIDHYEFRSDFNHVTGDRNQLEYGLGMILYNLNRGTVEAYGSKSLRLPVELGKEQGLEGAVYLSDLYRVLPWLSLSAGLRYVVYTPLGPQTVYTYLPGSPLDIRYTSDTLSYGSSRPIHWYYLPEVRAAVNLETDRNGSVKLAFNQMHQNLFMLSNTISIAPNTQWKLADYHLRPSKADQVSAGIFRTLPKGGWETSLEFYYKDTRYYPEFKDGADFLNNSRVETTVLQGNQEAYGFEFMLKRSRRKLDGWLSYTYSRSIVTVNGDQVWNQINNGKAFPANYDIPHALNSIINYHFNRRVTMSTVMTYQSGKPITYPTAIYYINGVPYVDYSARNKYRIPDYFRLDVSVTIEGNLRKKKLLHNSLMLSVYNVTGRENAYSVFFRTEEGKIKGYKYSVVGVPIFTATWLFKLGNYASD